MIDVVIKSSLIALVAWACSAIFRRQSAAVRHMIWAVGLAFALLAPLCTPLLPSLEVGLIPADAGITGLPAPAILIADVIVVSATPSISPADVVFYVWLAGVSIGAFWLLGGAARLTWMAFRAKPFQDETWMRLMVEVSGSLHLKRSIRLLQSDAPMVGAWGILRGHVLLPTDAGSWPEERIRVVLIHELAHIKRNDWPVQIMAECARAIYWFNPLFWLACGRLRRESEHASDDIVLGSGFDGKNYASHLLELARALKGTGAAWSAVLAMAQRRHLERRFQAMLNSSLNRRPASAGMIIAIAIMAVCVSLPLAAIGTPGQTTQVTRVSPPKPPLPPPPVSALTPPTPPPPPPPPPPSVGRQVQSGFGTLSGTVYDASGAVIPSARAVATNLGTKATLTVPSNASGDFTFQRLPEGDYSLQADRPGFATARIAKITIAANQDVKQNVSLVVGNIQEKVTVMASGPPKSQTLIPAGTPRRIRIGGNVGAMKMLSGARPVYPASAKNAGIEGTVGLQAIIGTDGKVQAIRVLSSIDADLTAAALEAVKQWHYSPTLLNGVPVETLANIDVEFKLPE